MREFIAEVKRAIPYFGFWETRQREEMIHALKTCTQVFECLPPLSKEKACEWLILRKEEGKSLRTRIIRFPGFCAGLLDNPVRQKAEVDSEYEDLFDVLNLLDADFSAFLKPFAPGFTGYQATARAIARRLFGQAEAKGKETPSFDEMREYILDTDLGMAFAKKLEGILEGDIMKVEEADFEISSPSVTAEAYFAVTRRKEVRREMAKSALSVLKAGLSEGRDIREFPESLRILAEYSERLAQWLFDRYACRGTLVGHTLETPKPRILKKKEVRKPHWRTGCEEVGQKVHTAV